MEIRRAAKIDIHTKRKERPRKAFGPAVARRISKERGKAYTSSDGSKSERESSGRRARNPDRISESRADDQFGRLRIVSLHIDKLRILKLIFEMYYTCYILSLRVELRTPYRNGVWIFVRILARCAFRWKFLGCGFSRRFYSAGRFSVATTSTLRGDI